MPKPTDQSRSHSISRVLLQISPDRFIFRPPLKVKGTSHKKQVNELSDKHGILQTCSIVSVAMLLNQQERPSEISLKLGYRTVNARKYVRCARTFYFLWGYVKVMSTVAKSMICIT